MRKFVLFFFLVSTAVAIYYFWPSIHSYFAPEAAQEPLAEEVVPMEEEVPSDQPGVRSVAGVHFGDSKAAVKSKLQGKDVRLSLNQNEVRELRYEDCYVGGIRYNGQSVFYFSPADKLIAVELRHHQWGSADSEEPEALAFFESVIAQYKHKYPELKLVTNQSTLKRAVCGQPVAGYDHSPIVITYTKEKNGYSFYNYDITVTYYEKRILGLYDDDI